MSVVDDMELWYTGNGLHHILDIYKIRTLASLPTGGTTVTSKAMAEKMLEGVKYASRQVEKFRRQTGTVDYRVTKATNDAIDAVHRHLQQDIEAKWDRPMLTEQEVADALTTHLVEQTPYTDLLDGSKETYEVVIGAGGGVGLAKPTTKSTSSKGTVQKLAEDVAKGTIKEVRKKADEDWRENH